MIYTKIISHKEFQKKGQKRGHDTKKINVLWTQHIDREWEILLEELNNEPRYIKSLGEEV